VVRSPERLLSVDLYLNLVERLFYRHDGCRRISSTNPVAGSGVFADEFSAQVVQRLAGASRSDALAINFVFVLSLILAGLAVVGVFIEIPFISNYAFWVAITAYVILAGLEHRK
jgi:hypothetical protein